MRLASKVKVMVVLATFGFAACGKKESKDENSKKETPASKPGTDRSSGEANESHSSTDLVGSWKSLCSKVDQNYLVIHLNLEADGGFKYLEQFFEDDSECLGEGVHSVSQEGQYTLKPLGEAYMLDLIALGETTSVSVTKIGNQMTMKNESGIEVKFRRN